MFPDRLKQIFEFRSVLTQDIKVIQMSPEPEDRTHLKGYKFAIKLVGWTTLLMAFCAGMSVDTCAIAAALYAGIDTLLQIGDAVKCPGFTKPKCHLFPRRVFAVSQWKIYAMGQFILFPCLAVTLFLATPEAR